jgi:predicted amidohydrolase YtcJ
MLRAPIWGLLLTCAIFGTLAQRLGDRTADLIMIHGRILTVDAHDSVAQAIAIRAGRIVLVGSDAQVLAMQRPGTLVIDLHGRTATPGLIDTHGHYAEFGAVNLYEINLQDAKSVAEIARRVQARVMGAKPGEWIVGRGWEQNQLVERRLLYAADLDRVSPKNPVWLVNTTGHFGTVNSYALRLAHIDDQTPDPKHGTIEHDSSGHVTGVLKEAANSRVSAMIPQPTYEQIGNGILHEVEGLHREGMTAIKDIGTPATWEAYSQLHAAGRLEERVCMLWRAGSTIQSAKAALGEIQHASPNPHHADDDRLLACGAKIFMDGSAIARTAWSYKPWYKSATEVDGENAGYPTTDPDVYREQIRLFHQAGISVGTHAIGDRAIDWVVDTYAEDLARHPVYGLRDSIIHSYLPTAHAIGKMAALERQFDSAYPEVQPSFLWWLGTSISASTGPSRLSSVMPLKSFEANGIRWGGGSDYSVVPFAARYGLWASVLRQTKEGTSPFGSGEAVDIHTALRSYTAWAARMLFLEREIGTLEPGKRADIAVWDRDPYSVPSEQLKEMKCELTLLDGVVVYRDAVAPITISMRASAAAKH